MTATVYFAQNACFFLTSPGESNDDEFDGDLPEPLAEMRAQGMRIIAGPGGQPLALPPGLGGAPTPMITSVFTDLDEMLGVLANAVDSLDPNDPAGADSFQIYGGPRLPLPVSDCEESIAVFALDEGFCVKHRRPVDMSVLSAAVSEPTLEGDEWKGKKAPPAWALAALRMFAPKAGGTSPMVLGFKTAAEVVDYVRSIADQRSR